jgi:hypothetical protein
MSILKLAEDLKDVPDHFLASEVRQPTGSYPGYLVVAELERRKGMRDRYMKEAPKSTVAKDLSEPSREQMMAAVAQMQQPAPQQQPLPPQMPMPPQMPPQIPQMPASGLMATPQASSLAATDAMASPRKRMAGGGLVAFQEGGDVKRFAGRDGSLVEEERPYVPNDPRYNKYKNPLLDNFLFSSHEEDVANLAKENIKNARQAAAPVPTVPAQKGQTIPTSINTPVADIPAKVDVPPPYSLQADLESKPFVLPPARGGAGNKYSKFFQNIQVPSAPTAAEDAATIQSGQDIYAAAVPNRLESVEKELGTRTQNLKDRRKSALNEALMMAGIGVLKSKSPGRYFGEGAEEGMLAYRQSMKDVRGGEDLMTQARQDLAKAQTLQDQGKFEAGQKMADRAIQKRDLALKEATTKAGIQAHGVNADLTAQGNETAQQHLELARVTAPYVAASHLGRLALTNARANNLNISDADQKAAEAAAYTEVISLMGKPGYAQAYEDAYYRNLQRRMQGSVPGQQVSNPLRGSGGPGAQLVTQ